MSIHAHSQLQVPTYMCTKCFHMEGDKHTAALVQATATPWASQVQLLLISGLHLALEQLNWEKEKSKRRCLPAAVKLDSSDFYRARV